MVVAGFESLPAAKNIKNEKKMERTKFMNVVRATEKNYRINYSISGYYRLMLDGEPIIDDSACEDLNEDYETAEAFFMRYLLEYEVPENKKELRCGNWYLKDEE